VYNNVIGSAGGLRGFFRSSASTYQLPRRSMSSTLTPSVPISPFVGSMFAQAGMGKYGSVSAILGSTDQNESNLRQRLTRTTSLATGLRPAGAAFKRSTSMRFEGLGQSGEYSGDDDEQAHAAGSTVHKMLIQHHTQQSNREETFERQRFASGEMMISSLFAGLLVREYQEDGFMGLIRELIGSGADAQHSWVRQVDVPEAWVEESEAIDGRTYRETVKRLLQFGCVPLGLYRSGDAPVRMEMEHGLEERQGAGGTAATKELSMMRAFGSGLFESGADDEPLLRSGFQYSIEEGLNVLQRGANPADDEFDEMYYECPTTGRRIRYQEASRGENVLPYVYTNPEPYTVVASSDAVFVLCPPELFIPHVW
jgi:hypothetical protein